MMADSTEQAVGIQGRKSGQHPAQGNINTGLKTHAGAADSQGRGHPFLRPGTGHSHSRLGILTGTLGLGAGRLRAG